MSLHHHHHGGNGHITHHQSRQTMFPGLEEFFHESPFDRDRFEDWMPVLSHPERGDEEGTLLHSSPSYEISETHSAYQIDIDVPGVKVDDMLIKLEHNGHQLKVKGTRRCQRGEKLYEYKFQKGFKIGDNIDTDKIAADLSDGVLSISCPKTEEMERKNHQVLVHRR